MENKNEPVSFGAVESLDDSRTLDAQSFDLSVDIGDGAKVPLDYPSVDDLCNQRKLGICTMCGVRMGVEQYHKDGVRLDEYWGYLIGKTLFDDPLFGHFEGSSALTMLKAANRFGVPEKKFCEKYPLKTDGTYAEFMQDFRKKYDGKVPAAVLLNAQKHKIPGYYRVFGDAHSGKSPSQPGVAAQVAVGRVVIARFALGDNFHTDKNGKYSRKAKDLLPLRTPDRVTSGHIMVINEFWIDRENFEFDFGGPNSWSRTWCPDNEKQEAGYYWFNFGDQKGYWTEAWVIAKPSDKYIFNKDLTMGSTGPDVVALQKYLVANGFMVMPEGVSYGYFGSITKAAVARYQTKYGIEPTAGYFGPITRGHLNSIQ